MTNDFSLSLHVLGFLTATEGKPLTSEVLAETYGTNPVVVRRILAKLKAAGLIASQRGVGGGSILSKNPDEISLREVYEAVHEDSVILQRPPQNTGPVPEVLSGYVDSLFTKAEAALFAELEKVTIAEMDSEVRPEICALLCKRDQ